MDAGNRVTSKYPELASKMMVLLFVMYGASTSLILTITKERATSSVPSSIIVRDVGNPDNVGSSLMASISNVTDAVLESAAPSLATKEIVPAPEPFRLRSETKVAASKAAFKSMMEPEAVKLFEPFPDPPKVILVVPRITLPPVIVKVNVKSSASESAT